ncbi:MAG: hypothetical protein B7Y50_02280 [Hydrogenophilales bacterium 28-61-11]|nr:MAG: hypothetical protein B7Y50_02280 [Hydrogenophilales bacterium 28-61-11]
MTGMNPPLNLFRPGAILARMNAHLPPAETLQNVLLTELIQRMAAGDEAALGRFYDATLSRVYGLALKITGRRELAEEVCVETFWQGWREASRYDTQRGGPMAWLMVMARSRALDTLRRLDRASSCAEPEIHLEFTACPRPGAGHLESGAAPAGGAGVLQGLIAPGNQQPDRPAARHR